MYIVNKGLEKVSLADLESAKALLYSLSDYDCQDTFKKQHICGTNKEGAFNVCFDDRKIVVITLEDAERICHWMLTLGCATVTIERLADA